MKKIKSLALMLSLLISGILCAQKVDLDKQPFTHKYRRWPNKVLDTSYKTFSVNVQKAVALDLYSNESANERVRIEGRKKVDNGGHIQIKINLEDLIVTSNQVKDRTDISKDKEGKVISSKSYYWVELVYTFAASATVNDFKGSKLSNYIMASRSAQQGWKTGEYDSYNAAAKFYNDNSLEVKTRLISEQINAAINALNSSLAYDFGYLTSADTEILWKLGSKKHAEFDAYNQAIESIRTSLGKLTADALPPDVITDLDPTIKYFESLPEKYSVPDDKMMRKLRYGAYYNLAAIYFYTENFDKAKEYADKLIANDYDSKDGERYIKEIEAVRERLAKHSAQTRHFVPDYMDAQAPNGSN